MSDVRWTRGGHVPRPSLLLLHYYCHPKLKSEKRDRPGNEATVTKQGNYSKQLLHTFPYSISLVPKATRLILSILLDMKLGLVKS